MRVGGEECEGLRENERGRGMRRGKCMCTATSHLFLDC